ncbi:DNA-directed RNA polymerase subunit K [Candidatus Gugararchaeum adminiculabundum]|nr:DNA-directed RNA polymerase subunit K [Candidatus Gugararchaeum adminiculabundum]
MKEVQLNHFEKTRIIGARALQLASGAPPLVEITEGTIDPVQVAYDEFEKNVIPLVVVRTH